MTLRYPDAVWRPLPEADRQPPIRATQIILHTVVGSPSPYGHFANADNPQESHLWVDEDGTTEQYVSLDRSADANYRANRRPDGTGAVSIETADDGTPEDTPWTPEQMDRLAKILAWCSAELSIPLEQCPSPTLPGVGWHAMWGAPSQWTNVRGKTCPGRARVAQVPELLDLARAVIHAATSPIPQEDDMPEYVMTPPAGSGKSAYIARYPDGRAVHIGGGEDRALTAVPHFPCSDVGEYTRLLEQSGTSYRD